MCYDDKIYKTFYWFPINIDINSSHFVGSANLLNVCGNVVGKLLLKTSANVNNNMDEYDRDYKKMRQMRGRL